MARRHKQGGARGQPDFRRHPVARKRKIRQALEANYEPRLFEQRRVSRHRRVPGFHCSLHGREASARENSVDSEQERWGGRHGRYVTKGLEMNQPCAFLPRIQLQG